MERRSSRFFTLSVPEFTLWVSIVGVGLFSEGFSQAAQLRHDPELGSTPQLPDLRQPEQESDITRLMLRLETEISAGRLSSPPADNVMETLEHILALVPDATRSDLASIDSMPSRFDKRASEARARGDNNAAEWFSTLRDALALASRAASAPAKMRSAPAPSPSGASPAATDDRITKVHPVEPMPGTKGDGTTGLLGHAARNANRSDGVQHPAESEATTISAEPKLAQLAQPDDVKRGGNPEPPSLPSLEPISPTIIAVLLKRGDVTMAQGDISAARLLFERAAAAGSGAGAAGLAKTYDPVFLTKLGASGIQADPGLASKWYRQARALGEDEAASLLRKLEQWKAENDGAMGKAGKQGYR